MTRVALVHEILSPYREPLFQALAAEPSLDFTVVHVARTEPRRDWEADFGDVAYPWRRVRAVRLHARRSLAIRLIPQGLGRALDEIDAEVVVVPGYGTASSLAALAWARRRRRGVVMWSEGAIHRSAPAVERLKQAFIKACQSYVVPGDMAREHLGELGADPSAIHVAPNCIDLNLFTPSTEPSHSVRRFVCVARLDRLKGLAAAIEGLDRADPEREAELLLVGGGPDRARLEPLAARLAVRVAFTGSVQYREVPCRLRSADAFVFPTQRDVWGFALQEAAATGLPLVSSVYAGATRELVVDGVTGWSVLPEPGSVARGMRRLLDLTPAGLHAMRAAARGAAERLSVRAAVPGFRAAVAQALERGAARQAG